MTTITKIETAEMLAALPLPAPFHAFPLALREGLRNAAACEVEIANLERQHAARCAAIAADVLERKGADGKPVAGNDTARKALIEQETAADPECRRIVADLDEAKRRRAFALADVEALKMAARLAGGAAAM